MTRTKSKPKPAPKPRREPRPADANGPAGEVLTLAEAAAYLRLAEADVVNLATSAGLPGRRVNTDWRFFKAAIQQWLSTPPPKGGMEGIWTAAGSWKDDPYLDEMLKEIYSKRGRTMTEE